MVAEPRIGCPPSCRPDGRRLNPEETCSEQVR
jgi:hypothetical protein